MNCYFSWTDVPPFYISGVTGVHSEKFDVGGGFERSVSSRSSDNISTENFRNSWGGKLKKISKGSVVKLDFKTDEERSRFAKMIRNKQKILVPVEVSKATTAVSQFKSKNEQKNFVKKGDHGMLWSESMKPFGSEHSFVVKKNTFLTNLEGEGFNYAAGTALLPTMSESGKFKVYKCCQDPVGKSLLEKDRKPVCKQTYLFQAINHRGQVLAKELTIPNQCMQNLDVIRNEDLQEFTQLMDYMQGNSKYYDLSSMEYNEFGRALLPLIPIKDKDITGAAPDGSYVHYQGPDPDKMDVWGKPEVLCSINLVAREFQNRCLNQYPNQYRRCTLQVGDIGFPTPAKAGKKDLLGHATHNNGECVDIRPPRNDNIHGGITYKSGSYDRDLAQMLVNLSVQNGANPYNLHFNDLSLKSTSGKNISDHDNHLHICFNNVKNLNNCEALNNGERRYVPRVAAQQATGEEIRYFTQAPRQQDNVRSVAGRTDMPKPGFVARTMDGAWTAATTLASDAKKRAEQIAQNQGLIEGPHHTDRSRWNKSSFDPDILNYIDEVTAEGSKDCAKPSEGSCDTSKTPKSQISPKLLKWVAEAANEYGVPPGLLMAIAHAETSFNPLANNTSGEDARGLAQFTNARNAAKYGLYYNAAKPNTNKIYSDEYNTPSRVYVNGNPVTLYPIWSPRGSLLAMAKKMREFMDRSYPMPLYDNNGKLTDKTIDISQVYKRSDIRTARYLAGMHNRGSMPLNSIAEYYRQNKKLPPDYGTAWETKRLRDPNAKDRQGRRIGSTPRKQILNKELLNRCYVSKIAGLCGDSDKDSYFEHYNGYFSKDSNSSGAQVWSVE